MLRLAAVLLLALAGSATLASSAPVGPRSLPIEAELRQARMEAAAAANEQRRLEQAASRARDEVTRLRARQLAAAQAIAATEAKISAASAEARIAAARLELQRRRLARQQAPVSALLAGLVLTSRRPPLLALADSSSAEELVRLKLLVEATAPVIRRQTAALSRELELGSEAQRLARSSLADLRSAREELGRRRQEFALLEAEAVELAGNRGARALSAGDTALASSERLSATERSAQGARQSAALAADLASFGPAPLPATARLEQPPLAYRLPADARITEGLGSVSANGVRSRGIGLQTRRGASLVAPADGTIAFSGPFRDYDGVIIIDHGGGWKTVLVNTGTRLKRGGRVRIGEQFAVALGPIEVELHKGGEPVSPALIAGSSAMLSNASKGG